MKEKKGITLIALVITVIILLILAGAAVSIGLNGDDLFSKANDAKTSWNSKVVEEQEEVDSYMRMLNSITDNIEQVIATPILVPDGETTPTPTLVPDGETTPTPTTVPGGTATPTVDPSVEYRYAETEEELIDAKDLKEGDIINYYYDTSENPIPCAVLFNDSTHGIEVVTLDCVKNDIVIGSDTSKSDPKAEAAFANGAPSGYEGLARYTAEQKVYFEKSRWSYNHALQTLKSYATEYMGHMAKNVRCIGAPDSELQKEDQLINMHKINESYTQLSDWDNLLKDGDTWQSCEELTKMEELGILGAQTAYWIASRKVSEQMTPDGLSYMTTYQMVYIDEGGTDSSTRIFSIAYIAAQNKTTVSVVVNKTCGLRPLITLREYIKVEKTGELEANGN